MNQIVRIALTFALCMMIPASVFAEYRYNAFGEAVPAQASYTVAATYNATQLGVDNLKNPTDLFVDNDKNVYILDAGDNRIIMLNANFEPVSIINKITSANGPESIEGANGLFVDGNGDIYIADTAKARVLVINRVGEVKREIRKPKSQLLDSSMAFEPKKVLVDKTGIVYIISQKTTQGAYMIGQNGEFLGFFGRNKVVLTPKRVVELALRKFASDAQRKGMENFIPVEFTNFDIDQKGFIYTVNSFSEAAGNDKMIRKLNPKGNSILYDGFMLQGDVKDTSDKDPKNHGWHTAYVDITVDQQNFIYALDSYNGRIFQYDNEGFQIAIFGGIGDKEGTFSAPVAIGNLNNNILVLDNKKANITIFKPTYFGKTMIEAMKLYNEGKFEECLVPFKEIIKMDANCNFAYIAMAMAYYDKGDYEKAEFYAEQSDIGVSVYSYAKKEIRNKIIRDHFVIIFFAVILMCLFIIIVQKIISVKVMEMNKKAIVKEGRA